MRDEGEEEMRAVNAKVQCWRLAGACVALVLTAVTVMSCGRPRPAAQTVALVYCGTELWIGNDQNPNLAPDDPSRLSGTL